MNALVFLTWFLVPLLVKSGKWKKAISPSNFLKRLHNKYEIVNINHINLDTIDDVKIPTYPDDGIISFSAFGNEFVINLNKHYELFPPGGMVIHSHLPNTKIPQRKNRPTSKICHYKGQVEGDPESTVILSLCQKRGIRGWIQAFDEIIVIRPALLHLNKFFKGGHKILGEHIVYKYDDIDRSDYDHLQEENEFCGFSENEKRNIDNSNSKNIEKKLNEIVEKHNHDKHDKTNYIFKTTKIKSRRNSRKLNQETVRYVELAAVNDPARIREYKKDHEDWYDELIESTTDIINTVAGFYYKQDWGTDVGTIQLVLQTQVLIFNWTASNGLLQFHPDRTTNSQATDTGQCNEVCDSESCEEPDDQCGSCSGRSDYCEAEYNDYLSKFQSYRTSQYAPDHDNAQLLSGYDFESSVIGYAAVGSMCSSGSSGGINQATYDDEYNGNIIAHEMGHNWDMQHDGNGNSCDPTDNIMASSGSPNGFVPKSFSDCSVDYLQEYVEDTSAIVCLDDEPAETAFAVCPNGFTEQGEACDCGQKNCELIDPCCDGSLCQLYADAQCSITDDCCTTGCKLATNGTVCRDKSTSNSCDIKADTCDGIHADCPNDYRFIEGTPCSAKNTYSGGSASDKEGLCYNGECISIQDKCYIDAKSKGGPGEEHRCESYTGTGGSNPFKTNSCSSRVKCDPDGPGGSSCYTVDTSYYWNDKDGTPCFENGDGSNDIMQCVGNTCFNSTEIYTYQWWTDFWLNCTIKCKNDEQKTDPAFDNGGLQNRTVFCGLQDGTKVDDSNCDPDDKPITQRFCNNYECDFCAETQDGGTICGDFGECDDDKEICVCDNGYGGSTCNVIPELDFVGVTKRVYVNASGWTITERADPFGLLNQTVDTEFTTVVHPQLGNWSITDLTLGDTISVRWNSSGDLFFLAVGLVDYDPDSYIMYVGNGLATDDPDSTCDEDDVGLEDSNCDDFSFVIPTDITPGVYRVVVRFNKELTVYSPNLTISCSEVKCNSAGHGKCSNNTDEVCTCDEYWSGDTCSEYTCSPWEFAAVSGDAYADAWTLPKCGGNNDGCDPLAANYSELCDCSTGSPNSQSHYVGTYCEVPNDGCVLLDIGTCDTEPECELDSNNNCVYSGCAIYNITECDRESYFNGSLLSGIPESNASTLQPWECYWNDTESLCKKKTCPELINLYTCSHGSLMSNIDEYESICNQSDDGTFNNVYCDCSTIDSGDDFNYWAKPDADTLSSIDINDNLDLFECSQCNLNCSHGAKINSDCTGCDGCDTEKYQGVRCDSLFWVVNQRIETISWQEAFSDRAEEFEEIWNQDMAYLTSKSTDEISIWTIKGSKGDSSIVYWRFIFTGLDKEVQTQIAGTETMLTLQKYAKTEGSPMFRGFLSSFTDTKYTLDWCIPERQECDPSKQIDFTKIFLICFCCSLAAHILAIAIYRFATRGRRRKKYEEKVREVRDAQKRLMNSHAKAKRVGLRDVSKSRARQISKAKTEKKKKEEKQLKDRVKQEKDMKRRESKQEERRKNSQVEMELGNRRQSKQNRQHRINSNSSRPNSSRKGSRRGSRQQHDIAPVAFGGGSGNDVVQPPSFNPNVLPPGWKVYYNNDGVPYYYNQNTGQTTWRHPNDNRGF